MRKHRSCIYYQYHLRLGNWPAGSKNTALAFINDITWPGLSLPPLGVGALSLDRGRTSSVREKENTALAFISDIACVSKKSRRVGKIPLLHLLRRSIAPKCIRMPWKGDERVRSERDKTPLLHFLAISIALTKIGRRVRKTPHLHLLRMSLFHLLCTEVYRVRTK